MSIDVLVDILRWAVLVVVTIICIACAYFALLLSAAQWFFKAPAGAKRPWYVRLAVQILKGSGH